MTNSPLTSVVVDSPIGPLIVVAHEAAVTRIHFGDVADATADHVTVAELASTPGRHEVLAVAATQLGEYFTGRRTAFDLPLDPAGTPFQREAWTALAEIPFGETISYADQARRLGDVKRSRAVGSANGRNPIPVVVPCHRVVGSDGRLTGFAGGIETKAWLLDHELRIRAQQA